MTPAPDPDPLWYAAPRSKDPYAHRLGPEGPTGIRRSLCAIRRQSWVPADEMTNADHTACPDCRLSSERRTPTPAAASPASARGGTP